MTVLEVDQESIENKSPDWWPQVAIHCYLLLLVKDTSFLLLWSSGL